MRDGVLMMKRERERVKRVKEYRRKKSKEVEKGRSEV